MPVYEAKADIVANVWKIVAHEGDTVDRGDILAILETMKMEIPVFAEGPGTVRSIMAKEGTIVQEGDVIAIVEERV
ncbi:MAG: biotin/lipoyl-binding carrier protein [Aeromicrobium sp.]